MNMYVYAQKVTAGKLVAGWITGNAVPTVDVLVLDPDMRNALRFDVDNNVEFMNDLLENGWSLMTAGNMYSSVQTEPSAAPFSS